MPLEVFDLVFRQLGRDDLDRCQLVSRSWDQLIRRGGQRYPKRVVNLLKLVFKDDVAHLSAASGQRRKEFAIPKGDTLE